MPFDSPEGFPPENCTLSSRGALALGQEDTSAGYCSGASREGKGPIASRHHLPLTKFFQLCQEKGVPVALRIITKP